MTRLDLGAVSAYAMAKEKGYQGTEEEFAVLMAESGENALAAAASAKEAADAAAKAAQDAADGVKQAVADDATKAEEAATLAQSVKDSIPEDYAALSEDVAALTKEIEKIGNALPLVFVEGKYLTGAEIGTSDGFGYSEPVYIAKGAVLAIRARGYLTNVNIVSKVTEDLSSITRIVRSVDSEYRWYEYTVAESGYYSFSGNITVKLIVFAKENELLGANVDMDGVAHETLDERLDYDFTAAFNASGISYIQPIFTEGFYITRYSTLEENSDFLYSEPFVVKAGMKIRVKARGYLTNVGIIAETDANLSTIKTVVRSVDSTYQWYEYTAPHDGYYFVSGNKDSIIIIKIVETGKVSNDLVFCDLSLWRKFGVVGDSYASGELYFGDTYADKYDISWGQILARKTGATCTNYSAGGLSTRSWLTYSKGLPLLLSSDPEDIYFLVLGINDYYHLGEDYLGSIADITSYTSYSDYADTFYGNYGKIIEQIKAYAPYSKIVMFTCANTNAVPALFNSAIVEIANHYEIPYIVQAEDEFFQSEIYTDMSGGHPTAIGYSGMASAFERLLIKCMRENHSYFRDSFMY